MAELPAFIKNFDPSQMCEQYRIWNERINVISRKDIDNVWEHHILHSLGIALYLQSQLPSEFARWSAIGGCRRVVKTSGHGGLKPFCSGREHKNALCEPTRDPWPDGGGGARREAVGGANCNAIGVLTPCGCVDGAPRVTVLDVGCGGGFPGIPLAAVFPNVQFTLCDSIGKKVRVASEVAAALGLRNVECIHSRVEDLPSSRRWDWVVSRAVTSLDNFLPWVRGRYTSGILYLKGGDISEELEACRRKFGVSLEACRKKFSVPCGPGKGIAAMPSVSTWPLSSVLDDPYYAEKLVVHLK